MADNSQNYDKEEEEASKALKRKQIRRRSLTTNTIRFAWRVQNRDLGGRQKEADQINMKRECFFKLLFCVLYWRFRAR